MQLSQLVPVPARWAATLSAAATLVLLAAGPAAAAPSVSTGNDISYPQCGSGYPPGAAFGIVGVNDGIANKVNPCLASEMQWAAASSGTATSSYSPADQPRSQLYLNTADPGNVYGGQPIADWPKDNSGGGADPYGACQTTSVKLSHHKTATVGRNSPACAWQYGWNLAGQDVRTFFANAVSATTLDANPGDYPWWLDVETVNSWQSSATSNGAAMNDATLEGMTADLSGYRNATSGSAAAVGIYSTAAAWSQITGGEATVDGNWTALTGQPTPAPLDGRPDWLPGATTEAGADTTCTADAAFTTTPNTPANVTIAQWVAGSIDSDVSC